MSRPLCNSDIKRTNRRLVLESIYESGTTSRTQLARELSLSKPAISDNLDVLLNTGIVSEIGQSDSGPSGGRKKILLQFNSANRYVISIDLSSYSVIFALSDLDGHILNTFEIFVSADTPAESCQDLLCSGTRALMQSFASRMDSVYCIAVAAPGCFDDDGNLLSCNAQCDCPPWYCIDLKSALSSTFDLPVIIYNNIKAAAIGEWALGSCRHERNALYLSTGIGIGVGILMDGSIYTGEGSDAGEIYDYIESDDQDASQNFEDRICLDYLRKQCSALADSPFPDPDRITMDQIVAAYQSGHPGVCRIVKHVCRRLAIMVHNQMNFISFRLICFAGEYAPFRDCFTRELEALYRTGSRPVPTVRGTELGKYGIIQGVIHLSRLRYFDEICSK